MKGRVSGLETSPGSGCGEAPHGLCLFALCAVTVGLAPERGLGSVLVFCASFV
jgi:hypothetical protein